MRMKNNFFLVKFQYYKSITGVAGFEPANGGVKVHSLTAWRHPRIFELEILIQIRKF
jgi:predicted NodU family carbamoyl transferase